MVCIEELMVSSLAVFAAIIMKEMLEDTLNYFAPTTGLSRFIVKITVSVLLIAAIIAVTQTST